MGPNPLLNLPFFLQALQKGSQGYVQGQDAADRHAALAHQMMIQDNQESRASQLFPYQLDAAQINNTNADAPNQPAPDLTDFYNRNQEPGDNAGFGGNRRDLPAEAGFYNAKKSRAIASIKANRPAATTGGSKDPNRDLREQARLADSEFKSIATALAKWKSADPIKDTIRQSMAKEAGMDPQAYEKVLNTRFAQAKANRDAAIKAYQAKTPGAAAFTDPAQTPGGTQIHVSADTLNAFKAALKGN